MQKLNTQKGTVREIVHDLRNPLLSIRLNAEFLRADNAQMEPETGDLFLNSCDSIISEVERLECIVNNLSAFAVEK